MKNPAREGVPGECGEFAILNDEVHAREGPYLLLSGSVVFREVSDGYQVRVSYA